ncbi:hypothetical protein ISF_00834 [Cordyceps fumosorosea ARSEF 2679]|uniref:Uncharacterized protein n=1 Tax=Cordyceps fumosorosea (strain ARSEF 2679) TaxID=1081104 RepID=A0A168EKZ6_CORFA|nr:hypothetical protein ISF_00834 [Cordyceps fumosorosea ARSEF 2679]OAA73933.1 hypothetical protein ISF_00834 [Cordyceps fumosorosea ARSEF 2679]
MARKSVKSEASTASPDPAAAPTPVKKVSKSKTSSSGSGSSTPAKSASKKNKDKDVAGTPAGTKTPKIPKTPKTPKTPKDKDAPVKQRRQSIKTPRASAEKQASGSTAPPLASLPPAAKLVAVEAVTLALLFAGRLALAAATGDELGGLRAAFPATPAELALLFGWRAAEVALAWVADLDLVDVGLLSFVAHAPALWLVATFYRVRPATALASALVDVVAPAAAFALARPRRSLKGPRLHDRELAAAPSLRLLVAALATCVYAAVVSLALRFALPRVLVLHFRGVPTVAPAYAASFASLLPTAAPFGLAAAGFLFAPYATAGPDGSERQFDPARATLGETLWWNAWGYTARGRVVIKRAALLTGVTAVGTGLTCALGVDGVSGVGAAAYAGVWALATGLTGLAVGLVGQE